MTIVDAVRHVEVIIRVIPFVFLIVGIVVATLLFISEKRRNDVRR